MSEKTPLQFNYDAETDVMSIEGINYAGDLFRQFGHAMPLDAPMKITKREESLLVVVAMEPGDPDWMGCPAGHQAIFIPVDAPPEVVAEELRKLADAIEGEEDEIKESGPSIILPPGMH